MTHECPQCGAQEEDEATLRCVACGFEMDEDALEAARVRAVLSGINASTLVGGDFDAASRAVQLYAEGKLIREVVGTLTAEGLSDEQATEIAHKVYTAQSAAQRKASRSVMLSGLLIMLIGIAVTAGSFLAGGVTILAWGAIVFGALQFFRGLSGGS